MYNIAICEDNSIHSNEIVNLFNQYSINENIKFNIDMFSTGKQLLIHGYNDYDVIILDIQMNEINGIEVAKIIRKTNNYVKIVFITALEKYWPEGYNVNAFRYILKPINEDIFYNEIKNLITDINKRKIFIPVENNGNIKKILISSIKYLEISNRKVIIHTDSGNYISTYKLKYWNEKLSSFSFANPHSSFLVNMNYVMEMDREKVTLLDGEYIYFSQRKFKNFKEKFIEFLAKL
ncbi:response regulator, virR [Clostridium tetani]|uniref:LytR/AlgR family response regulator transcription factor n=1 Tax=Clostridium tetani TaxID=1513 RepID=UPI000E19E95A|nr:LytTR family DNA-binding domain-containing protein [Clostridium tetani]RXI74452.1 DNA-binding response regulator [Clostridium tetani]WFN62767.1 LytTR family DNA-binding domain-containing protein [Clostridium tetani]BDR83364.1 DNA-binding response regulator [Clostridium tetani]SUY54967.1 response regulator, virR [Clostridium tetani]